jgi:hypothetical protein
MLSLLPQRKISHTVFGQLSEKPTHHELVSEVAVGVTGGSSFRPTVKRIYSAAEFRMSGSDFDVLILSREYVTFEM